MSRQDSWTRLRRAVLLASGVGIATVRRLRELPMHFSSHSEWSYEQLSPLLTGLRLISEAFHRHTACYSRAVQDGGLGTAARDQGTKGPRDQGTKGPKDQGTKGLRDQGTKGSRD
jgi:hypothetical protein